MPNAVIYARYSSAGQREESIEGQIRECSAYAEKKGYCLVGTYTDRALSATTDRRPDFQRMIKESEKKRFDIVICWKHDRFARNRYDAAMYKARLKANGVRIEYAVESVPEGAEGIIIESVMEGYAEYYSANLSQNVKRGLYDSALKRYTLGYRPEGLCEGEDHRFALAPSAPIVKWIFESYAAEMKVADIIRVLNEQGTLTDWGKPFNQNIIHTIIHNERYYGMYRYADIEDPNGIPPIVSKELWDKCQEIAAKRKKAPRRSEGADGYILSGKLFCGHCGEPMTAQSGYGKSGTLYRYYGCNGKKKHVCEMHNVPKQYIEDRVVDILRKVSFSDAIIDLFADRFVIWQRESQQNSILPSLEAQLKDVESKLANVEKAIETGIITQTLPKRLAELEQQKADIQKAMGEYYLEEPMLSKEEVQAFLKSFQRGDDNDPEWRQYLVKTFLNKAVLFEDGRLLLHLNYSGEYNEISIGLLKEAEKGDEVFDFETPCPASANIERTWVYFLDGQMLVVSFII